MKKLILKRFTNHLFLKRIGRDLLSRFFQGYPEISSTWPGSNGINSNSEADFYSALASLFMRPDIVPPRMIEDLLAIEEMSSEAGLARSTDWPSVSNRLRPESTAEDIALQVWLVCPELLAREHNIMRITRMTSFEYAAHPLAPRTACNSRPDPPDRLAVFNLSQSLDQWFAQHQRGIDTTRIEVFSIEGDTWFMIRHGDICKRVTKVERQESLTLHFRPERDDVVVWSSRMRELRVNARTKAERDLYIRQFGFHLHGDADYFSQRRPYTLEPLRTLGRDSLDPEGIEGINRIRLCKVSVRLENALNESITREADDLFSCGPISPFQGGPIPINGFLERALFEIQFAGAMKSHPVELRVPNVLKISRRCDPEPVHQWLCARGFRKPEDVVSA